MLNACIYLCLRVSHSWDSPSSWSLSFVDPCDCWNNVCVCWWCRHVLMFLCLGEWHCMGGGSSLHQLHCIITQGHCNEIPSFWKRAFEPFPAPEYCVFCSERITDRTRCFRSWKSSSSQLSRITSFMYHGCRSKIYWVNMNEVRRCQWSCCYYSMACLPFCWTLPISMLWRMEVHWWWMWLEMSNKSPLWFYQSSSSRVRWSSLEY